MPHACSDLVAQQRQHYGCLLMLSSWASAGLLLVVGPADQPASGMFSTAFVIEGSDDTLQL